MSAAAPVVQCTGVIKDYRGLRPLRLLDLQVPAGDRVVIGGIDVIGAEVVTNLINGATLPDEGEVRVFGQATHDITDGASRDESAAGHRRVRHQIHLPAQGSTAAPVCRVSRHLCRVSRHRVV